jgi:hypothetical protein
LNLTPWRNYQVIIKHLIEKQMRERKENVRRGNYTDKKEKKIFLIYKEIRNGAVAKSYMTNGLLSPHIHV